MADQESTTVDLIPFAKLAIGDQSTLTVNARDLYVYLGLSSDYSLWIRRAIKRSNLIENIDYIVYAQVVENPKGGRPSSEHHLTFDAAKHVAMMSSATKGHEVREWFIAKEKELATLQTRSPLERYPELRAIQDLLLVTAEARDEAALARKEAHAAEVRAVRAENKADIALEDLHRMTVQEFILKNGLYRQFPPSHYKRIGKWLGDYSQRYGLRARKAPVVGKSWDTENSYELQAFGAWLDYEQKRPRQIALVEKPTSS